MENETIAQRAERIVRQEVFLCVSSIVSDFESLGDQPAIDMCWPVTDWEEAAIQEGWMESAGTWTHPDHETEYDSADELCTEENIDPYEREVFEHWAISNWLASELESRGEKVDRDFHGLTVWARCTTGQAIAVDSVIENIAKAVLERNAPKSA